MASINKIILTFRSQGQHHQVTSQMTERTAKKWNKMTFKDHWLEVNKVPTRVLTWGVDLNDLTTEVTELFLCISGNPGVTEYYVTFLESLQARTGVPVWMISHAGHEVPSTNHSPKLVFPSLSDQSNHCLYDLHGQVQHKLAFIQAYIPAHVRLTLIGHSVGARIITDLLREAPNLGPSVRGCYLLFPTLERIRNTPAADMLVPIINYLAPVIFFLAGIFRLFPRVIQRFLVSTTLFIQHRQSADSHCVDATVKLIDPRVLRQVFFLALDEMDKIKELDTKTLGQHESKWRMYFGTQDDWCPVTFYSNLAERCPVIRAELCSENIKHAFVLHASDRMAEKLAAWFEEDRVAKDGGIMSPS